MARIATFRALSRVFAGRIVRLASWVSLLAAAALLTLIIILAYSVNNLWLLLLIVYIPVTVIGIGIFVAAHVVLRALYPHQLTSSQKRAINAFNDKIVHLLEARAITPWMLAGITLKDLFVHRELTTLRQLLNESTSLKQDFADLEKKLNNQT